MLSFYIIFYIEFNNAFIDESRTVLIILSIKSWLLFINSILLITPLNVSLIYTSWNPFNLLLSLGTSRYVSEPSVNVIVAYRYLKLNSLKILI